MAKSKRKPEENRLSRKDKIIIALSATQTAAIIATAIITAVKG